MCGIAGICDLILSLDERAAAVQRMCTAMEHRGPDDMGIRSQGPLTLGMRRLSIFDPAHGRQPMTTADGRFTLIFNGAIYNFKALRAELAAAGHAFHTDCDTEVLLHAYAHWGRNCLARLRGMFAFAIWDAQKEELFLARDPFGIKPLYFFHQNRRLLFASELNALLASGLVDPMLDPASVSDYLAWLAVPAPRTIYRDIFSLRPGECLSFSADTFERRAAWTFTAIPRDHTVSHSREEFIRELRTRLEQTVSAHAIADVPVGTFLSGGLDSAVVTGLMARTQGTRLKTFSIGFEESTFSEAGAAAETARHFGTDHHAIILSGAEVARDMETLISALDQPTGDGINTYYASRAAKAGGVTVALSGLGGDELFGGYPSFIQAPRLQKWLSAWRLVPRPAQTPFLALLQRRGTSGQKLAEILSHARTFNETASLQRLVLARPSRLALLHPDARQLIATRSVFHPELPALDEELLDADPLGTISAWELRTYMADVLLRDSDVMSMRHSLELRVPFIDRPLIEWLWRQPAHFRFEKGKSSLVAATRDLLPPGLLQRKKQGFALPFPLWMKRQLKPFLDHTFSEGNLARTGLVDAHATARLWSHYVNGNDPHAWSRLWSLAMLIAFSQRSRPPVKYASPEPITLRQKSSRTLLLAPEIFASEGGIPRILQSYLKALCDLAGPADAVRLVSLNDRTVDAAALQRCAGDRVEDWRMCGRNKAAFVRATITLSRDCDRLVCGHIRQLSVAWAAKKRNPLLRYYLIAHGIEVWRPFTLTERLALRGAEKIICVSDYTRRQLLRYCPLPSGKVVVVPNGLDASFRIGPGLSHNEQNPVILVVTRLSATERYKGVDTLIAAMAQIVRAKPHAVLRIIGRGDDLPRLQQLAARHGVQDSVEFCGYVDDTRLGNELRACSLFALPSSEEGFGLVYVEAMAAGRPCLGARAGGVPDVITPETGILIEAGNVDDIARGCLAALARKWDEEIILNRARHFSYPAFKDRLSAVLALS